MRIIPQVPQVVGDLMTDPFLANRLPNFVLHRIKFHAARLFPFQHPDDVGALIVLNDLSQLIDR